MGLHFSPPVQEHISAHLFNAIWSDIDESLACGLTTSLTAETGTVLGDGVGGGERGAVTGGATVESEEDGNVERTGELGIAGSLLLVLLEGKLGPLSVELSAARMCASWNNWKSHIICSKIKFFLTSWEKLETSRSFFSEEGAARPEISIVCCPRAVFLT